MVLCYKEENLVRPVLCLDGTALLGRNRLELLRAVNKQIGVGLGNDSSLVGFLDEELVTLLLGEMNGILLGLEVEAGALHVIGG